MANRYIRGDKETRMYRLGIIEQDDIVYFIDEALNEKLAESEREKGQNANSKPRV